MNQEYFDVVGQEMINSFLEYTKHFELRIYAENLICKLPNNIRIDYYDWNVSCKPNWIKFKSKTNDAKNIKFAKKGFAFLHAMQTVKTKYLIWIDADIKFLSNITPKIITDTIKKNLIGYFDHSYLKLGGHSAESGYVILDTTHPKYTDFVNLYEHYYTVETQPSDIDCWYDGQVCALTASHFKEVYNLSKLSYNTTTHTPLNESPLNQYMIHHKGKLAKRYIKNTK